MKILAILTVRNEAAFLLDWLAHHRAAGFTDFLVFSNDCDDGTDAMLDRLHAMGQITHVPNPGPYDKGGIQFTAMKLADKLDIVKQADWILPLDVDEFVNIHVGDHTVPALLDALPDATAITLTWRWFGNNGIVEYTDQPVPHQFPKAAPVVMTWPWRSAMFKTLYRNDKSYRNIGVHRPRNLRDAATPQRWFDGSGRELPELFHEKRLFSNYGQDNYALVQLNHYALGAMESYVLKADRGRAVHSDHLLGLDYWVERNYASETDDSIRALDAPVAAIRAELAADPTLARLHDAAVRWRKARFETLMEQEPFRALMGRLLVTPASTPVAPQHSAWLRMFARRALEREGRTDKLTKK